jgi:hypothetical protein
MPFSGSEWLLFNAKSAIFQLYHGENDDEVRFVLSAGFTYRLDRLNPRAS